MTNMRSAHDLPARLASRHGRAGRSLARCLVTTVVVAGCGGLEPVAPYTPITDPAALFMALTIDHGAVNLSTAAPYDEFKLTATPRDALGAPMAGMPAATFRSNDTTSVWVTPDGLLRARMPGTGIMVIAELVADGNIRHADTTLVNVTDIAAPQMLDIFAMEPVTPGNTEWAMISPESVFGQLLFTLSSGRNFAPGYVLRAQDASGVAIPGLVVEFESLDPDTGVVHPVHGHVTLLQPGTARIVARTTAYGVSMADTATFDVTLPIIAGFFIQQGRNGGPWTMTPESVTIRPGGYVSWPNLTRDSISIVFDDPSGASAIEEYCIAFGGDHCQDGDIANFMHRTASNFPGRIRGRQFREPGTYTFRLEPAGLTGQVIVTETLP